MHNVIFQDFIHSTRGVLCIVLVATLMLGVASYPDATPTSWHGLSVTLCKKLLQAGYL